MGRERLEVVERRRHRGQGECSDRDRDQGAASHGTSNVAEMPGARPCPGAHRTR